mmetsp:Transcript_71690/g.207618  ORF Transcript_71690/g.207618 Transcript_71690/m.207618 type:complete len:275 (-) Transcript_71690:1021-1845(-)
MNYLPDGLLANPAQSRWSLRRESHLSRGAPLRVSAMPEVPTSDDDLARLRMRRRLWCGRWRGPRMWRRKGAAWRRPSGYEADPIEEVAMLLLVAGDHLGRDAMAPEQAPVRCNMVGHPWPREAMREDLQRHRVLESQELLSGGVPHLHQRLRNLRLREEEGDVGGVARSAGLALGVDLGIRGVGAAARCMHECGEADVAPGACQAPGKVPCVAREEAICHRHANLVPPVQARGVQSVVVVALDDAGIAFEEHRHDEAIREPDVHLLTQDGGHER